MSILAETSFLCAAHRQQANSPLALEYLGNRSAVIAVTSLVLYEFRQGVHFQVWLHRHDATKGYNAKVAAAMLARLEENLALGILQTLDLDWPAVHGRAGQLADRHTTGSGARGFDLLHVAAALEGQAVEFLSFDGPQREVAAQEGLTVGP